MSCLTSSGPREQGGSGTCSTSSTRPGAEFEPWAGQVRSRADFTPELVAPGRQAVRDFAVVGHCRGQMATFKVPRYVRFVTEWPMSGTKFQKARLRQWIADELAAASVTEVPRLTRPA
jgi:acyl-CoA synthetase (AMP-forming)/AMP-acid ligase II